MPLPFQPRKKIPDGLKAAISFLTRIPVPMGIMAASLPWFAPVGLFIGIFCTAATLAFYHILLQSCLPGFEAALGSGWLWICAEIWISGALHWDGVADLGDAIQANGAKFWQILKDSRLGAFGAISLGMIIMGQFIGACLHISLIQSGSWLPAATLALAPAWARLGPIWLGYKACPHHGPSLAATICGNATIGILSVALMEAAIILAITFCLGLSVLRCLAILAGQALINSWYKKMAQKHGGISGDFFGSHIEASQLFFLLATISV